MTSDTAPTLPVYTKPRTDSLSEAVGATASRLQDEVLGYRGERLQAAARGRLAVLRRSAGSLPEKHPLAWQSVLEALQPALSDRLLGSGDAPSASERAAFDALTLFALHMQSAKSPMHVRERSFATAVGALIRKGGSSGSLKPRFDALLAARDHRSRLTHARSLITLLRGADIGFNYGWFASDLRALSGAQRNKVLLRWGRDVVFGPRRAQQPESETSAPSASPAS